MPDAEFHAKTSASPAPVTPACTTWTTPPCAAKSNSDGNAVLTLASGVTSAKVSAAMSYSVKLEGLSFDQSARPSCATGQTCTAPGATGFALARFVRVPSESQR